MSLLRKAKFHASYPSYADIQADIQEMDAEVIAIAGKSNSGKSSLINALCDQKKLAKTSNSPGRTQQFVYFDLQSKRYLVDLPGYGFARVSKQVKDNWSREISNFFEQYDSLRAVVLTSDCRRNLSDEDKLLLDYCQHLELPVFVCLTKVDKVNQRQLQQCRRYYESFFNDCRKVKHATIQYAMVSNIKRINLAVVANWISQQFST